MARTDAKPDPGRGVHGISVAAELVGIAPQSLRLYERRGLLEPARSTGGTRRYSSEDLERLHRIAELLADGVTLTGVAIVLDLQDTNARLQADLDVTGPDSDQESTDRSSSTQPGGSPRRSPASEWQPTAGKGLQHLGAQPPTIAGAQPEPHRPATSQSRLPEDRLPAPLVHPDGGAKGLQRVPQQCEVFGAPQDQTTLHHDCLDHYTSWAAVTKVGSGQGPGGSLPGVLISQRPCES